MTKKNCTKCGNLHPLKQFSFKNKRKGTRASVCKICHVTYLREHYQKKKEMYLKNGRKQNLKLRADNTTKLIGYLQQHPCIDCGESDPIVLEFDHVRGEKDKPISYMIHHHAWQQVKREIKKCDVRCANCHIRKTAKDLHWRKAAFLAHGVIGNTPHSE